MRLVRCLNSHCSVLSSLEHNAVCQDKRRVFDDFMIVFAINPTLHNLLSMLHAGKHLNLTRKRA